jgi:uncharacterized membrane protein YhaH (DUF805 family)
MAMRDLLRLLFSFKGRIGRQTFWLTLLSLIASCVGIISLSAPLNDVFGFGAFASVIFFPAVFVFVIGSLAVSAKRVHDRNKSGLWIIPFVFMPNALEKATDQMNGGTPEWLLLIAAFGLGVWGLVEMGLLRGTVGPNDYGEDPLPTKSTATSETANL